MAADVQLPSIRHPCGCSFPRDRVVGGAVSDYGGNGTGVIISSRAAGYTPKGQ